MTSKLITNKLAHFQSLQMPDWDTGWVIERIWFLTDSHIHGPMIMLDTTAVQTLDCWPPPPGWIWRWRGTCPSRGSRGRPAPTRGAPPKHLDLDKRIKPYMQTIFAKVLKLKSFINLFFFIHIEDFEKFAKKWCANLYWNRLRTDADGKIKLLIWLEYPSGGSDP